MPRGKRFKEKEIGKIVALNKKNISIKSISEELKRFHHVIQNYLKDSTACSKKIFFRM